MTSARDGGHLPSDERPIRALSGIAGHVTSSLAVGLSLYALYWVLFLVQPQIYRVSFLLVALVLTFLLFPGGRGGRDRVSPFDWALAAAAIVALAWPLIDFDRFVYRAANPSSLDEVLGVLTIALVLEATRRAVGWILPATALGIPGVCLGGPAFDRVGLPLFAHRGYGVERLIGTLYMTLEGIFGVPLDVAATYIMLFTIYGAVLEYIGAGRILHRLGDGGDAGDRGRPPRPVGPSRSQDSCSARCPEAVSRRR